LSVKASVAFAGRAWRSGSGQNTYGEFADADHQRVWGDAQIAVLLEETVDHDDSDWADEPHRFGRLARRVWNPLLEAEAVFEA
jgi:exodeoxyribonuclease V gamma subunit